jgi:endonuclease YncB( thermonuclease family)
MGLLVVRGTLRVSQFWPKGGADADTATVEVVLEGKSPFTYVDEKTGRHPTRALYGAEVLGRQGRQRVVKHDKRLDTDKINVRLQGIDAPELHYQPTVKGSAGKNGKFRQGLSETCAHALWDYLSQLGPDRIPCEVLSRVRKPSDVCDVYGRVVGNLIIGSDGSRIDLNHWLIREGLGLPGLYNSMTKNEIRQVLADHRLAKQNRRGVFSAPYVSTKLVTFKPTLRYRKGPATFAPFSDKGKINFPKFFRRQADHHVWRAIGDPDTPARLLAYIAGKPADVAIGVRRFLDHAGATTGREFKDQFPQLATFVRKSVYPTGSELVFWEADAKLLKAGTKKEVTSW